MSTCMTLPPPNCFRNRGATSATAAFALKNLLNLRRGFCGTTPGGLQSAFAQEVTLTNPIPVLIVYGTVIVLEDQIVRFYDDIYDQDAELDRVLDKGYPYRR